jgi:hypothetical protein
MFRAFATAIGKRHSNVNSIRSKAIDWMIDNRDKVEAFIVMEEDGSSIDFDEYIDKMSQDREWGDAICLHASARSHNVYVKVLKRLIGGDFVWLSAGDPVNAESIHLYWELEHYENLIGAADAMGL